MKSLCRNLIVIAGLLLLVVGRIEAGQPLPLIICFGDSITAGYGLALEDAYPDDLERLLHKHGYNYRVDNHGLSGATTKDALSMVPQVVSKHPEVVIVEFGGNDGLRGLRLENTEQNLDAVLTALDAAHIKIVLAGITLPPEYGKDYIAQFEKLFRDQAAKHHAALIPMLYRDLIHKPGMIQQDGVHPTADGSIVLAKTVAETLEPMLIKTGTRH
jgi:acyl-CoA thioesterase I